MSDESQLSSQVSQEYSDSNVKTDSQSDEETFVVKLRGLPWAATVDDIADFLGDVRMVDGKNSIFLTTTREGRSNGEAYVELLTEEDLTKALERDHKNIGSRYIEVFRTDRSEMDWILKHRGNDDDRDGVVRLRGLPYGCSKEEIAQFFTGLEIKPNGITLCTNFSGRSTGEAFVQFANRDVAEKSLLKHREKIGHRYIEIFRSNMSEMQKSLFSLRGGGFGGDNSMGGGVGPVRSGVPLGMGYGGARPTPYDRNNRFGGRNRSGGFDNMDENSGGSFGANNGGGGFGGNNYGGAGFGGVGFGGGFGGGNGFGANDFSTDNVWNNDASASLMNNPEKRGGQHNVFMRGLPFRVTEDDILIFFKPIVPTNINLLNDRRGRRSGEADVDFASHDDAVAAMAKDKCNIGNRYIELFLNSTADRW